MSTESGSRKGAESANGAERPRLAVTLGDPCGIGAEVVLKALAESERLDRIARIVAVGDERHLRATARDLKIKWPFAAVVSELPEGRWEKPVLLDLAKKSMPTLSGLRPLRRASISVWPRSASPASENASLCMGAVTTASTDPARASSLALSIASPAARPARAET